MSVQVLLGGELLVDGALEVNGVSGVLLRVAGLPSGGVWLLFSFPSGEVRGFSLTHRQAIDLAYGLPRDLGSTRRALKQRVKRADRRRRSAAAKLVAAKLRGGG